jgi:DNA helicase-2/ATP-dependent DNA helicase PcrA
MSAAPKDAIHPLLAGLNDAQLQAVAAPLGNTLVLAGAGSGKTKVLTHRIAWLIQEEHASPGSIFSVTFTNKAAREMQGRAEKLMAGHSLKGMWIGTFHGLCHRFLRRHHEDVGLPQTWQVLDADDQQRIIKRIITGELGLDEKVYPPREVTWWINSKKDEGLRPRHISPQSDLENRYREIYGIYEDRCQQSGLVDFAELLLRTVELLQDHADVRILYQDRFRHVLVDEFQDTNAIQYDLIRLLGGTPGPGDRAEAAKIMAIKAAASPDKNAAKGPTGPDAHADLFGGGKKTVFAVGDDDQCIYGWRGAVVGHLEQFRRDFADVAFVRLEQNYRSTKLILEAANTVIGNNAGRLGKTLWTATEGGEVIDFFNATDEIDEAAYVIDRIRRFVKDPLPSFAAGPTHGVAATLGTKSIQAGHTRPLSDCAILYRSNAQSRAFEEQLIRAGLPYRITGGVKFFERLEIKDALAHLRLIISPQDDAAFERAIAAPATGIGAKTIDLIRQEARKLRRPLWTAAEAMVKAGALPKRAHEAIDGFMKGVTRRRISIESLPLEEQVSLVIDHSGLREHHRGNDPKGNDGRLENLDELISVASRFTERGNRGFDEDENLLPLISFLVHAALEAGENQAEVGEEAVQLMTLHAAKGLEFPFVALVGLEEGLFPNPKASGEEGRLDEERRLMYVGITRAREILLLSCAETRRQYGQTNMQKPSRFLREIPRPLLNPVRMNQRKGVASVNAPQWKTAADKNEPLRRGSTVRHGKHGSGVVLAIEADTNRVKVAFSRGQVLWVEEADVT